MKELKDNSIYQLSLWSDEETNAESKERLLDRPQFENGIYNGMYKGKKNKPYKSSNKIDNVYDYLISLGFTLLAENHPAVLACPWLTKNKV
jgi:hypothetical protein